MAENPIKYSFIVPVYNGEDFLQDCIRSLCDIDYCPKSYEIIIINDGSTDSTQTIIDNLISEHSNIRSACQPNQGQGEARNLGISLAKGEWILFADADDWINSKNILKSFDELLSKYSSLDIDFIKSSSLTREYNRVINYYDYILQKEEIIQGKDLLTKFSFAAHVYLGCYKKSFLEKVKYPFRKIHGYEDTDWTFIVNLKANNVILIDFPFYSYFYNLKSTSASPRLSSFIGYIDSLNAMMRIIKTEKMSHRVRDAACALTRNKMLNPMAGILKYSRNFKISDSVNILKQLDFSLINSEIRPYCTRQERFILYWLVSHSISLVSLIKFMTFVKRKVKSTIKFIR